jgi:non-ribosomal peptide synthetase component F
LQKTPFSFDVSVWEFFWPVLTGACLVISPPDAHKDGMRMTQIIQQHKITIAHFVPSMLSAFLDMADRVTCQSLRHVICSGEALPANLQNKFFEKLPAQLHNLYGPTEASIDVTMWMCERESEDTVVPIGRPIANTQIYLLDAYRNPVPIGVPGELFIGGIGLARGYQHRSALTAERFVPSPFTKQPGERLYRTGDLARYRADGTIEYLGRADHR